MAGSAAYRYVTILKYALFPRSSITSAFFATVHIEAKKLGLVGVDTGVTIKRNVERLWPHVYSRRHVALPLDCRLFTALRRSYGILAAIAASQLRRATRLNIIGLLSAFEVGARNILIVLSSTAAAGLIVGSVDVPVSASASSSGFVGIVGGSLFAG